MCMLKMKGRAASRKLFKIYWTLCVALVLLMCLLYYIIQYLNKNGEKALILQNNPKAKFVNQMKPTLFATSTSRNISDEITVVTAYWNLGRYVKGGLRRQINMSLYYRWASSFRYVLNPLVIYTDSKDFANLLFSLRNSTTLRTKLFIISRNSSWAFGNAERIRQIYSTPGYPKHHPNTVVPEYACAQHAKYELTARAARENVYRTNYFAWLDMGYFRNRKSEKRFRLVKPNGFNDSLVAMNEVYRKNNNITIQRIFRGNIVWLGGGLFLGRHDVIIALEDQFRRAVDYFLSKNLMNTDQQVLYGMYSKEGLEQLKPEIQVQTYWSRGAWFYLGKKMVEELSEY